MAAVGPALEVENIGKCFRLVKSSAGRGGAFGRRAVSAVRELWALRDVTFSVDTGTILGVIGPNGAGKSTLLKILSRVTVPTLGRVRGRGRVISLLEVGTSFQPDMSGRENVHLNAALYGISRAEVDRCLDDIVAFAETGDFLDMPVRHYSSGMYLRLAFSVAVNLRPDILLADEVLAVGDIAFQRRCLERVSQAGREGMTVLFVSHDMAAIQSLCPRTLYLHAGRAVELGPTAEVVGRYERSLTGESRLDAEVSPARLENDKIFLRGVRLLSAQGNPVGALRASEEAFVEFAVEAKAPLTDVRCALDAYVKGTHVFRALQPMGFHPRPGDIYRVRMRLPPHLLAETEYSLNAGVNFSSAEETPPLASYNALSFRVYESTGSAEPLEGAFAGAWPGLVRPRLEWAVERGRVVASRGV
jgi:lipopolysaccharide transport system ATP-binding protein